MTRDTKRLLLDTVIGTVALDHNRRRFHNQYDFLHRRDNYLYSWYYPYQPSSSLLLRRFAADISSLYQRIVSLTGLRARKDWRRVLVSDSVELFHFD